MARAKADEPRVLMKVTVSDHDWVLGEAKKKGITGIQMLSMLIRKEKGEE
jgi:hypothetical protein